MSRYRIKYDAEWEVDTGIDPAIIETKDLLMEFEAKGQVYAIKSTFRCLPIMRRSCNPHSENHFN